MKRPKGPDLKMPELKAPAAIADVFYDLRDRRLLPLVGLVLVAIVATPILLGQKTETTLPPEAADAIQALKEAGGERTSSLTVVEARPGLRDYRKRLRRRTPLDPFRSLGKPNLKGAKLGGGEKGSSGSGSVTSTSTTVKKTETDNGSSTTKTTTTTGPGGTTTTTHGSSETGLVFFSWAINVRIVKTVDGKKQEPVVKEGLVAPAGLPGAKTPVVTYLGPAREGDKVNGKALLLVNNEVSSIEGDAKCLSGDQVCQLLEVEPGFPVVLTYGKGNARYAITILKLDLVVSDHR